MPNANPLSLIGCSRSCAPTAATTTIRQHAGPKPVGAIAPLDGPSPFDLLARFVELLGETNCCQQAGARQQRAPHRGDVTGSISLFTFAKPESDEVGHAKIDFWRSTVVGGVVLSCVCVRARASTFVLFLFLLFSSPFNLNLSFSRSRSLTRPLKLRNAPAVTQPKAARPDHRPSWII